MRGTIPVRGRDTRLTGLLTFLQDVISAFRPVPTRRMAPTIVTGEKVFVTLEKHGDIVEVHVDRVLANGRWVRPTEAHRRAVACLGAYLWQVSDDERLG